MVKLSARLLGKREGLHSLYPSPNILKVTKPTRLRWAGHIARMDLTEMGTNTRSWVHIAQDRDYRRALVNAALNLSVP